MIVTRSNHELAIMARIAHHQTDFHRVLIALHC